MSEEISYIVNEYITLKLEEGKTLICIKGEPFSYYSRLGLFAIEDITQNEHSNSKVEPINVNQKPPAKKKFDGRSTRFPPRIHIFPILPLLPEQEFWEHCSDLQRWTDSNYNTEALFYWVAFPLLEKLAGIGNPQIHRIFINEISKGIETGTPPVRHFIFDENYMRYLPIEKREDLFNTYLKNYYATKDLRILFEFGKHGIVIARTLLDEYLTKLHDLFDTVDFNKLIEFYFKITDLFSIVELFELGDPYAKILVQQLKPLVEDYFLNKKSPPLPLKFPDDLLLINL